MHAHPLGQDAADIGSVLAEGRAGPGTAGLYRAEHEAAAVRLDDRAERGRDAGPVQLDDHRHSGGEFDDLRERRLGDLDDEPATRRLWGRSGGGRQICTGG